MKKITVLLITLLLTLTLAGCSDLCIGTECLTDDETDPTEIEECEDPEPVETDIENLLYFDHLNGHGEVTIDHIAFILFEEEMLDYVKYQVTYLSCTCRNSSVNYWQVAYVEINKSDDSIQKISYGLDNETSDHPYTAGMWGDSSPTPDGMYLEDFENEFIPWLLGQTAADLDGINAFTNDPAGYHGIFNDTVIDNQTLIDDFAGSSVSTNNMIRIMKALLDHHTENYG